MVLAQREVLSDEQRIFSGLGVAVGAVGQFWKGAKGAATTPAAKVVAAEIEVFGEELALALRASRRSWYKTLRGAVTSQAMDAFEQKAALHLLQKEERALLGVGDDGVRRILGIPKNAPAKSGLSEAPDFLSVTKGNKLALTEAKGGTQVGEAIGQLTNAMRKVKEMGLLGDVERVEIIVRKGVKLTDENLTIANGYLTHISDGKPAKIKDIEGLTNCFIRVLEL